jgi:hypothetical protein
MSSTGNDVGFDDLFDNASFHATIRLSQPASRPTKWPKGATKMRRHTDFGEQGIARLGDGDAHYRQITQREPVPRASHVSIAAANRAVPKAAPPAAQRPAAGRQRGPVPASRVSILMGGRAAAKAAQPAAQRAAAGRQRAAGPAQPTSDRRQWSWSDTSSA